MLVIANLMYMDGKSLKIELDETQLEAFSQTISKLEIYWNPNQTHGLWTDINKIRHIEFIRQNEKENEKVREVRSDSEEIPAEDERHSDIEDAHSAG